MKKHYLVYQITNLINQKIYIGIHGTDNLDDGYFGSGSYLKRAIKKYGMENFQKDILFVFDNPEEMIAKEAELVDRKFIARKDVYNIKLGGEGWLTFDSVTVKDSEGNCFRVHKTDERWLSGELITPSTGMINTYDELGKMYLVRVNDPRYVSGELRHIAKGTVVVKDANGNRFRVSMDDPRYISGELKAQTTGFRHAIDKFGNSYFVSVTDHRIATGELFSISRGRKHTESTKLKIGVGNKISQKGVRNSQYGTCWIYNLELRENKKIRKEESVTWLELGWIVGRKINFDIIKCTKPRTPKIKKIRQKQLSLVIDGVFFNSCKINKIKSIFSVEINSVADLVKIKDLLVHLYYHKAMSLVGISKLYNTNHVTILGYFKSFGIDRRSLKESQSNYRAELYRRDSGPDCRPGV